MMSVNSRAEHRLRVAGVVALVVFFGLQRSPSAQWITLTLPNTPRTPDGKPNLAAPAPKADDGKPDLSGILASSERRQQST